MNEKVAIIVPVYNVEAYLRQCMDSIAAQTYRNIKVYLVNDGSTDSSGDILDEYADKHPDLFRVITQENKGLSMARNAALDVLADENYIAFIDSDDYVKPNYVRRMLETALENDAQLVQASNTHFFEDGATDDKIAELEGMFTIAENADIICDITPSAWGKLYSRHLFDEPGMRYPEGLLHEDLAITYRLAARCKKVACIPEFLYMYRVRPGSIITKQSNTMRKATSYKDIAEIILADKYREVYAEQFEYMAIYAFRLSVLCFIKADAPAKQIAEVLGVQEAKLPQWRKNRILHKKTKQESIRMRLWMKLFSHGYVRLLKALFAANKLWHIFKRSV